MIRFSHKLIGKECTCLYRLHGTGNVLKRQSGTIEKVTLVADRDASYLTVRLKNGKGFRRLRKDRMLELEVSD